ncbi:MAG: hypothetical protein ACO316_03845, partial [Candidatus Nanopelagicales bacterium]
PLNEILGWEKWNSGWISDKKIECINSSKQITLNPVSDKNGKLAIVPLSSTEAIVIELRKKQRFDEYLTQPGVIVYKVDSTIKTGEGAIIVLNGQNPVKKKKSVTYKNVNVKVLDKNKVSITIS